MLSPIRPRPPGSGVSLWVRDTSPADQLGKLTVRLTSCQPGPDIIQLTDRKLNFGSTVQVKLRARLTLDSVSHHGIVPCSDPGRLTVTVAPRGAALRRHLLDHTRYLSCLMYMPRAPDKLAS
eukprot:268520-Hanusia_phi.AAC.1